MQKLLISIFLILLLDAGYLQAAPLVLNISSHIQTRIEAAAAGSSTGNSQALHAAELVSRFYTKRSFAPVWLDKQGLLLHVDQLIHAIGQAEKEALNPEDYHISSIRSLLIRVNSADIRHDRLTPLLAQLEIRKRQSDLIYR